MLEPRQRTVIPLHMTAPSRAEVKKRHQLNLSPTFKVELELRYSFKMHTIGKTISLRVRVEQRSHTDGQQSDNEEVMRDYRSSSQNDAI